MRYRLHLVAAGATKGNTLFNIAAPISDVAKTTLLKALAFIKS